MIYDPVLVVGTGRSGTSTVARILHEKFGICMGPDSIKTPLENNPLGGYEDIDFVNTNRALLKGYCTLPEWAESVNDLISMKCHQPWGFKDPHMARILGLYIAMFDKPKIIWCRRDKGLVVKSIMRHWGEAETEERASLHYDITEKILDRFYSKMFFRSNIFQINFGNARMSEDDIEKTLRGMIKC